MDFGKKPPTRVSATTDPRFEPPRFEPLIDTEQAAALLRIHPKTLQRMARRGEVRSYQLGKLWRFRASDLVKSVSVEVAS
jgi:excisionase family DNA binding protein